MRTFYTSTKGCCELDDVNFPDESKQHKWFEDNLHILFPNLKLVKSKMQISDKIPDTVVYDPQAHTFVAIEYKNRRSDTVRQQAENYLNKMDDNRATLTLAYNKSYNAHEDPNSFKWNNIYAIIVAPEFNKDQIYAAGKKDNECLYELRKFENGIVTLRYIAGKRGPIDTAVKTTPKILETNTEQERTSNTNPHESKNPLYKTLRDRMLSTFSGVKELPTKYYVGFGRDGEYLLCTAIVQRSKIKVYFGRKGDFTEDEFVKDVSDPGHHGTGNYYAPVRDEKDIKRLLLKLKQCKTGKRRT